MLAKSTKSSTDPPAARKMMVLGSIQAEGSCAHGASERAVGIKKCVTPPKHQPNHPVVRQRVAHPSHSPLRLTGPRARAHHRQRHRRSSG